MNASLERAAAEQADTVAKALVETARRGGTEADFRREAARILEDAGLAAGLTIFPRDEFSVARGRVDSVYNRLVLEYKRPGVLNDSNRSAATRAVIDQVKGYILDVAEREKREAHRLAGVATDGFFFIFVRRVGEGWSVDDPLPVNAASAERFLRLLYSLSTGAALVPENLVNDFGPQNIRAQRAVRALYTAMRGTKHPLVSKLFEQWRLFFSEATDYKEWAETIESKPEFRKFVGSLWTKEQIKHLDAARVFFVLHTYYALLIKLVASLAAASFAGGEAAPLATLAAKQGDDLRQAMADLERGGLFREYGIRNFLEGDFFGWYLAAWNEEVEDAVSALIQRLAEYDPGTLELAPENARDLLKKLYHYLLPREIRHDLGEYYTPDWLAERLITQTLGQMDLGDPTKRVLDPACGSGTFLVILIKYIRGRAERQKMPPAKVLGFILQNVVGIDLNPLAVIAARTNYLLALGDLIKARMDDIDIPVYQADSVLTPSQGTDLFDGGVYPLKTSVGVFRIPAFFAHRDRMDALADVLDDAVESGVKPDVFLSRIEKAARITAEKMKTAKVELEALYKQLRELHDHGLNGVWARIIKNSFAPLFLEPCHYIVGNPPWVNWEHLPDEYRRSSMPLWDHYGLFPKREKGMETILGASKYDISMLMTYVAADRYLRTQGRLGFVITETVFKTVGAGQGFRRFVLPDKTPIGPTLVEDMVEIQPFEGAVNRTAIVALTKGRAVSYPVPFSKWRKRIAGRGGSLGFDTPYEEITSQKITFSQSYAEPVDPADITSAWITAPRRVLSALRKMRGKSGYIARKGVTASANGVFWMNIMGKRPDGTIIATNVNEDAKIKVTSTQFAVEPELVYPLLRGRDVARWKGSPSLHILLTHKEGMRLNAIPETDMQKVYPKAWRYLATHQSILRKTGIFQRFFRPESPFYSMFNIGDYTFSKFKLVMREIASGVTCAVVDKQDGKVVVPDHKLILIDTSTAAEAHYLCAVMNSAPSRAFVGSYCIETQFSAHVLTLMAIPQFKKNIDEHVVLADLSVRAHKATKNGDDQAVQRIELEIDLAAAKLWGLSDEELAEIKRSLEAT